MNNEPVAWKAYEEVHFNDQYILRWVREGDEYVNRMTKETMEDLKSVVRQQQAEIEELKTCLIVEQEHNERMVEDRSKYEALAHVGGVEAGKELKELTDEEITEIFDTTFEVRDFEDSFIKFARAILRKAQDERN